MNPDDLGKSLKAQRELGDFQKRTIRIPHFGVVPKYMKIYMEDPLKVPL